MDGKRIAAENWQLKPSCSRKDELGVVEDLNKVIGAFRL